MNSRYGVESTGCNTVTGGVERSGADLKEVYWEPEEWKNTLDATLNLDVKYERFGEIHEVEKEYKIISRELKPDVADPMEGSDVEMLEEIIWHLGIGPNEGRRGNRSRRKPDERNVFDTGCSVNNCSTPNKITSMEWMIWRYKYASEVDGNYTSGDLSIGNIDVNLLTLTKLRKQWFDYIEAVNNELSASANGTHTDYSSWLTTGANEWDTDGVYPVSVHNDIMTKIGSTTITRANLLDGWVQQESNKIHWGVNATEYRINVGAGDSRGSIGFHQIQTRYIWGQISGANCTYFNTRNLYEPRVGPSAIVWWGSQTGCGSAFRQAMFGTHDGLYNNSTNAVKIRRSSHDTAALALNSNYATDDYERLSKGIAGYNQGTGSLNNTSWPELLKNISSTNGTEAIRKGINYSIEVKEHANINLRQYLWLDNDNGTDFCFWYGEDDWNGMTWSAARAEALTQIVGNGRRIACP